MKVVIMRGVSGSGKSTKAKEMAKEHTKSSNSRAIVCSADHYFVDPISGRYEFNPKKLGEAHAFCRGRYTAAIELGIPLIIIDNTNTRRWEFTSYVKIAKANDYECEEMVVGELDETSLKTYANRNVHNVSLEHIRKTARRFEI